MTTDTLTPHDAVRPRTFDTFIGQEKIKRRLAVSIDRAKDDGRPLDHVFLDGRSGAGKTTLAELIADRLGAKLAVVTHPAAGLAIARHLWRADVDENDDVVVLFDEAHGWRSDKHVIPLLTLLEQGFIDTQIDKFFFHKVTAIVATTERQDLKDTIRQRLPIKLRFVAYTDAELTQIVEGMASRAGVWLRPGTAEALGVACAGSPRIARDLVLAARDLGDASAEEILDFCDIHPDGLSTEHVRYLSCLADTGGGQAGLETLAARLDLDTKAVKDLENLLLDRHYIGRDRTLGRVLTAAGRRRLG